MSQEKRIAKRPRIHQKISPLANDGRNTPVPDISPKPERSESEATLLKQVENPLGDSHKF
jgi:hypothetical protein